MKHILIIAVVILLGGSAVTADFEYTVSVRGGVSTIAGGHSDSAKFTLRGTYGVGLSYRFHESWLADLEVSWHKLYNDVTAGSSFTFGGDKADATAVWKSARMGALISRHLLSLGRRAHVSGGLGGGLLIWKFQDPSADTTLKAQGSRNETADYSASEIFVTAATGVTMPLGERLELSSVLRVDYMTSAGAEFQTGVNSSRPRWLVGFSVGVGFLFGRVGPRWEWPSERAWPSTETTSETLTERTDSAYTVAPRDPPLTGSSERLPTRDSDGDGVSDDRDDCPQTDERARGMVDIFGCPVDSDFDGIPDYLDRCPFGRVGAQVDETGCPVDSDADGVPDGLDDCPHTLYGVDVDWYGCIDLSIFDKPLMLHIDYAPGSFEVDPVNRERIKELARVLLVAPEIRLEISGYTDNIGQAQANRHLSDKRARRVRDFLVADGVSEDRIKVFGKGEADFIASNDTAEGRAENRRVEIVFYR